ncbi:MAG TPA: SDR family oxidoreductase [Noviherbaspirillum sp.]|nr:SDR family oxidoreductase [Noviherbaspirillum sp.]
MKPLAIQARACLRGLLLLTCVLQLGACASLTQPGPADRQAIAGKTFVVTGASSGIGRAVAHELAASGANIVLAARRAEVLDEVAGEVRRVGGTPLVVVTDVSRAQEMERLAQAAIGHFGRIDVWINNAGVGALGRFEDVPARDHARVIDVNVNGVIYGSHAALRQFIAQGRGTLVNISSVQGQIPTPYQSSYAASKAAVLGLGRALNQELRLARRDRIRVVTVLPWAVDTPFFEHAANYTGRAARSIAYDDPTMVARAIVWVSLHPRDEFPVGWKAGGAYAGHNLLPALTERVAADVEHATQIESGPPAPPTSGNLHQPVRGGATVEGGLRSHSAR